MSVTERPRPEDPTSGPRPVVRRGLADGPPPRPPRPLPPPADAEPAAVERAFEVDGKRWVAWRGGRGTTGTGAYGLGLVEAIHFRPGDREGRPEREALLPAGRFDALHDDELRVLLRQARKVVTP